MDSLFVSIKQTLIKIKVTLSIGTGLFSPSGYFVCFHGRKVGESIVYVDDDSDTVQANDPVVLRDLMEQEANNSAMWLRDNRLCVAGEKSKFMVLGTRKLRASKVTNEAKIVVDGKEITETRSEKLLVVVINNELTWKNHLHGDNENDGLVQQLSKLSY